MKTNEELINDFLIYLQKVNKSHIFKKDIIHQTFNDDYIRICVVYKNKENPVLLAINKPYETKDFTIFGKRLFSYQKQTEPIILFIMGDDNAKKIRAKRELLVFARNNLYNICEMCYKEWTDQHDRDFISKIL